MEIRTKFKKNQKAWCLWLGFDLAKGYEPRKATIIESVEQNEIKEQCYKLHYDNSKIDFIDSEDYIFATKEEAQKECERRNKGEQK